MIPEISAFVRKAVRTGGLKRGNHQSHPEIVVLTVFIFHAGRRSFTQVVMFARPRLDLLIEAKGATQSVLQ
jgi:hypothetical protein